MHIASFKISPSMSFMDGIKRRQALKYSLSILATFLLICGCTTVEFVRKDISPSKRAILRYSSPSNANREARYQEEVRKKASAFCGGEYKTTKEYQAREATGSSTGIGTGFGVGMGGILVGGSNQNTAMYNFVEVECQ